MPSRLLGLLAAMVLLAACGSSGKGAAGATTTLAASTTEAPATTVAATTTTVALSPLGSPDAAATALIDAWRKGDRAGALLVATPAAVDAMFGQAVQATSDRGCQDPIGGTSSCAFGYGSGLLSITTSMAGGGWIVQSATFE